MSSLENMSLAVVSLRLLLLMRLYRSTGCDRAHRPFDKNALTRVRHVEPLRCNQKIIKTEKEEKENQTLQSFVHS